MPSRMLSGLLLLLASAPSAAGIPVPAYMDAPVPAKAAKAKDAGWKLATTRHFRVYSQLDEPALRRFTSQLAQFDALLRDLSGLPADYEARPLTIYMVRNPVGVARAGNMDWGSVYGFYAGAAQECFAVVPQTTETDPYGISPQTVLFHEYAHHFMLQNFPTLYSSWYVEGFADFYSTVTFEDDGKVAVGRPAMARLATLAMDWGPSTSQMLQPDRWGNTQGDVFQRYARGWLLTHYLSLSDKRGGQLRAYLVARARGLSEKEAFEQGLHASFADIDRETMAYFKARRIRYGLIPAPPAPADLTIARVSPAVAAVLPEIPRLRSVEDQKRERNVFVPSRDVAADIGRSAAAYPDDAFVQELYAEAAVEDGKTAEAHAAASKALVLDPQNARAQLVLARLAMGAAGKDSIAVAAARKLIVKANRLTPDDPLPLLAYYKSFAADDETAPEVAVQGLERAQELAPQDDEMRMLLARRYIDAKSYVRAAALLRPVAFAPHKSDERTAAQALLATIPIDRPDGTPPPVDGATAKKAEPAGG